MGAFCRELGPFVASLDGVELGENHKLTLKITDDTSPHKTAAFGTAAKDEYFTGRNITGEGLLTETTLAQFAAVMPSTTVTGSELMIASPVGTSLKSLAGKLVLKSVIGGVTSVTPSEWITLFNAAFKVDMEIVADAETDREYKCMFTAFPADSVPSGETYKIGDIGAFGYGETS